MSKSPRVHTAEFKARVALAACKGDRTLSEIAAQYQVHVKWVQGWKKPMLEGAIGRAGVRPATCTIPHSARPL